MIRNEIVRVKAGFEAKRPRLRRDVHAPALLQGSTLSRRASIRLRYNARELEGGVPGVVPA